MNGGIMRAVAVLFLAALVGIQVGVGAVSTHAGGTVDSLVNGDVDCDVDATAIDAAIVLQYDAGLAGSMACEENSDVNADGASNSEDSQLVLQYEAALVATLARMSLEITTPSGACTTEEATTVCSIPAGSEFEVAVLMEPTPPEGYVAMQTEVFFDELAYHPTESPDDEIIWPQNALPLRALSAGSLDAAVAHGSLSSIIPPYPVSDYAGPLVELTFTCPDSVERADLVLLSYEGFGDAGPGESGNPLGAYVILPDHNPEPGVTMGRQDVDLDLDGDFDGASGYSEADMLVTDHVRVECTS